MTCNLCICMCVSAHIYSCVCMSDVCACANVSACNLCMCVVSIKLFTQLPYNEYYNCKHYDCSYYMFVQYIHTRTRMCARAHLHVCPSV